MEIQTLSQPTISSHLRALYSLIRKDWKQYWRYPLNAASTVFQPLIWIAPIYFMGLAFSVNGKAYGFAQFSGTTDFMSFILLGTVLESFTTPCSGAWASAQERHGLRRDGIQLPDAYPATVDPGRTLCHEPDDHSAHIHGHAAGRRAALRL